ncbi:MAG TPA: YfhO family protein, partial [Acidobacteriota bacterium]|nr:YfhO family protein [Acidobacteriota bacterium]
GELEPQEYSLTLSRTDECSANLDSIRVSTLLPIPGESDPGEVRLTSFQPNQLRLSATLKRSSFVVLSEVYYPGWEAYVDGQPVPLLKADYILRALPVPAGEHDIAVRFRSRTLRWGLVISLLSIVALGAILKWGRTRGSPVSAAGQLAT